MRNRRKWSKIYALQCPISGVFFYVGETNNHLSERLKQHYYSHNKRVKRKINSIRRIGLLPIIICLHENKGYRRYVGEKYWIEKLIEEGHKLYNKVLIPIKTV